MTIDRLLDGQFPPTFSFTQSEAREIDVKPSIALNGYFGSQPSSRAIPKKRIGQMSQLILTAHPGIHDAGAALLPFSSSD